MFALGKPEDLILNEDKTTKPRSHHGCEVQEIEI